MSIATRAGDDGTTGLMYNRRVPKSHPRLEAYGSVDELNAALGLARSNAEQAFIGDHLLLIQKGLITLMGELATVPEDLERYRKDGFAVVNTEMIRKLDELVTKIESETMPFKGWAIPGNDASSATLDVARTACRRAERCVSKLREAGEMNNVDVLVYLNRLSDVLWLMARWVEKQTN